MALIPKGIANVRDPLEHKQSMDGSAFDLDADTMMRLAGMGGGIPSKFEGPSVEEIAERKQRKQREQYEHQRQMLGCNGYSDEQLARLRESRHNNAPTAPADLPIGTKVWVNLPSSTGRSLDQVVATGTVRTTWGNVVEVALDEPICDTRMVAVSRDAVRTRKELVEAPQHFQVGDRVRAVRDVGRNRYVGFEGTVMVESPAGVTVQSDSGTMHGFCRSDLELLESAQNRVVTKTYVDQRSQPLGIPVLDLPQETYAATLELAGGRLVEVPGPDPAEWEQVAEQRWDAAANVRALIASDCGTRHADIQTNRQEDVVRVETGHCVTHEEGRCWLHDMARVINAEEEGTAGGGSRRGALLRSLRTYRRRPPVDPHADRPFPTLRAYLW